MIAPCLAQPGRHLLVGDPRVAASRTCFISSSEPCRSCVRSVRIQLPVQTAPQHYCTAQGTAAGSLRCQATASGRTETAAVVEYLLLLQSKPGVDAESMEVLLDSLWSLQYMVPSIMYAAAGSITDCTVCGQGQQQPELCAADSNGEEAQSTGRFTHAVHFRLANRLALENLQKHPLMSQVQELVNQQCSKSAHIVFEGMVAKRLEALFRRGDEFASGVEHILLLQPGSGGGVGADAFLERLAALAESSVAGGIQASYGAVICCVHTAATHVLMTRFAAPQQIEQFLRTPACTAVMQQDPRVPVVAASSLCISMQPTEESTKIDGTGSLGI